MCPFWAGFDWVAYFFIMVLFSCFLSMPNNFLLDARLNFLPCWVLDIFTFLWEFLSVVPSYGYFFYLNLKFIGISSVLSPVLVNPYCWDKTPPCTNATALLIMGFSRLAGGDKHSPWPSPQTPVWVAHTVDSNPFRLFLPPISDSFLTCICWSVLNWYWRGPSLLPPFLFLLAGFYKQFSSLVLCLVNSSFLDSLESLLHLLNSETCLSSPSLCHGLYIPSSQHGETFIELTLFAFHLSGITFLLHNIQCLANCFLIYFVYL